MIEVFSDRSQCWRLKGALTQCFIRPPSGTCYWWLFAASQSHFGAFCRKPYHESFCTAQYMQSLELARVLDR